MRSIYNKAALVSLVLLYASRCFAQAGRVQTPTADPAVAQRGQDIFAANCAACHGTDARGGRGPDLGHSLVVTHDTTGQALAAYVRVGNPAAGMPAANLTDQQFSDISVFIRSTAQSHAIRSSSVDLTSVPLGDAQAGEAYFNGEGNCTSCHSVSGDLKGIGAKYAPQLLQARIVYPRGHGGYPGFGQAPLDPPLTATAVLPNGRRISGSVLMVSDYLITVRDAAGIRYTVSRTDAAKVEIKDPLQAHLDRLNVLTDKQMHDLTAYLAGMK